MRPGVAHDGARNPSNARQPHVTRCPREGNRLRHAEYYRVTCAGGRVAYATLRRVAHGGASHPAEAGNPTFHLSFPKERATGGRMSPCVACATRESSDAGRRPPRVSIGHPLDEEPPEGGGPLELPPRMPMARRTRRVGAAPALADPTGVAHGGASCPAEAGNPTFHPGERATGRRMSPSVACAGGSVARPTPPRSPRSECAAERALSGSRTGHRPAARASRAGPVAARRIALHTELPDTPCEMHPDGGSRS